MLAELFVRCFSVFSVVEYDCFFGFVYCVDDSVISDSYGPFALEFSSKGFSKGRVCFQILYG
jgi:hypothetical protein